MPKTNHTQSGNGEKKFSPVPLCERKRVQRRWTPSEEDAPIKLFSKGEDIETLVRNFRRSQKAIKQKLAHLGLNVAAAKVDVSGDLLVPAELCRRI